MAGHRPCIIPPLSCNAPRRSIEGEVRYAFFDLPTRVDAAVVNAARAEAAGLDCYMVAQVERADPIAVLAVVVERVPRIELTTGVIAIQ